MTIVIGNIATISLVQPNLIQPFLCIDLQVTKSNLASKATNNQLTNWYLEDSVVVVTLHDEKHNFWSSVTFSCWRFLSSLFPTHILKKKGHVIRETVS